MQGQQSSQSSFFAMIHDELIPANHLLRRLSAAVAFSFVPELVSDYYCPDNGRPSWDPLLLFKAVFLQFLYDLSDRQVQHCGLAKMTVQVGIVCIVVNCKRIAKLQKIACRIAASDAFGGMRLKMASLWVKILCRDIGFFDDYAEDIPLWVPVDRVNVRMLCYLCPDEIEALLPTTVQPSLGVGATDNQQRQAHMALTEVAAAIMGAYGPAICVEHLWFIGHFYHENMKQMNTALGSANCVYPPCQLRAALCTAGVAYSGAIPSECPLAGFCSYDQEAYQSALDLAGT